LADLGVLGVNGELGSLPSSTGENGENGSIWRRKGEKVCGERGRPFLLSGE
jgi:hypothetical protein